MPRPFRFGVQLWSLPGASFAERVRRIEALGYASAFWPDHFGPQLEPVAALAAAAAVTTRLRIGSLVYGVDYRHPVVLAKAAATITCPTHGRHASACTARTKRRSRSPTRSRTSAARRPRNCADVARSPTTSAAARLAHARSASLHAPFTSAPLSSARTAITSRAVRSSIAGRF